MYTKVIGLWLVVMLVAGCATMSDETRTKTEGTAAGAGIGALLGAGLGYILGGKEGALIGAGVGAAAGGISGYYYGKHVASRKKDYARQEDYLDALIVSAHEVNEKTEALRQEIAQLETETARLIQRYNQKAIQRGQLENQEQILAKKVDEGQEQLKILEWEIKIQQQALADEKQAEQQSQESMTRFNDLQNEIDRLERNKEKLEDDVSRLAAIQIRPSA